MSCPRCGDRGARTVKLFVDRRLLLAPRVTIGEIGIGLRSAACRALVVGLVFGANRFLAKAYEAYLYYLGPTPKIIFFPGHDHVVRRRPRLEGRDGHGLVLLPGRAQRQSPACARSILC